MVIISLQGVVKEDVMKVTQLTSHVIVTNTVRYTILVAMTTAKHVRRKMVKRKTPVSLLYYFLDCSTFNTIKTHTFGRSTE